MLPVSKSWFVVSEDIFLVARYLDIDTEKVIDGDGVVYQVKCTPSELAQVRELADMEVGHG